MPVTTYSVEIEVPDEHDIEGVDPGGSVTVEVDESEYVLAAARDQGVWLPAFCQQGWCTTCAAEVLDGDLDHSDAKRYYAVDAQAGFALTCVATPRSDLRLRACAEIAMKEHREANGLQPTP